MKLLFVLSEFLPESGGGIISYYAGILPRLVNAGYSVDVLVASTDSVDRPTIQIDGVTVSYLKSEYLVRFENCFERFRLDCPTFAAFLPLAWAVYEQVNHGEGYDLVETTDFPLLFAPWVVSQDSPPVVVALHGSCGQIDWYQHFERNSMDGDLLRLVERAAFYSTPGLYTNSKLNALFWETETGRDIPVLLPHAGTNESKIACNLNVSSSKSGVVIGRFQNWKGAAVLCEALRVNQTSAIRWIGRDVVEDNEGIPYSDVLRRSFPEIVGSRLILEGNKSRDEVLAEISGASFVCVPSEWDVFNLSVVEAMSIGTTVICSERAGASMLIEHGQNGFLFNPSKPSELATCIESLSQLSATEREKLISNAKETIRLRLDSEILIQERISYYFEVIGSFDGWKRSEWLKKALSPCHESESHLERLYSFKALDLFRTAVVKVIEGISRRIRGGSCNSKMLFNA